MTTGRETASEPGSSRALVASVVSGLLSYLASRLPDPLGQHAVHWGAGLIFGALVLAPATSSWGRRLAVVAASGLVYRTAVWLAVELVAEGGVPAWISCALCGALAVPLLGVVTRRAVPHRLHLRRHIAAIAGGAIAGALIGIAAGGHGDAWWRIDLPVAAGYVLWQASYAAGHLRPAFDHPAG